MFDIKAHVILKEVFVLLFLWFLLISLHRCAGFMDIETDTNPIDRSIAHLLFHRPSDPSAVPASDSLSLRSHTLVIFCTSLLTFHFNRPRCYVRLIFWVLTDRCMNLLLAHPRCLRNRFAKKKQLLVLRNDANRSHSHSR